MTIDEANRQSSAQRAENMTETAVEQTKAKSNAGQTIANGQRKVNTKHSLRSKEVRRALLRKIRWNGGRVAKACLFYDMDPRNLRFYRKKHPDFDQKVSKAVEFGIKQHEINMSDGIRTGEAYLAQLLDRVDLDEQQLKAKDIIDIVKLLRNEKAKVDKRQVNIQNTYNFDNLTPDELKTMLALQDKVASNQLIPQHEQELLEPEPANV